MGEAKIQSKGCLSSRDIRKKDFLILKSHVRRFMQLNRQYTHKSKRGREDVSDPFKQYALTISWMRDNSKFCTFHNDYGHLIDDCRQLKYEVEKLVK